MAKRIIWICILIGLGVGAWYGWKQWKTDKLDTDGAVVCVQNCDTPEQKARFAQENSGDTADGNSDRRQHSSSEDARIIAASPGNGPVSSNDPGLPNGNNQAASNVISEGQKPVGGGTYDADAMSNSSTAARPTSSMTSNAPENPIGQTQPQLQTLPQSQRQPILAPVGLPLSDSRSPNAPNDLRFTGSGAYQWYRQGNLTWRIDTATGRSCIIYATMEEWRNQIVLSHGCGRKA